MSENCFKVIVLGKEVIWKFSVIESIFCPLFDQGCRKIWSRSYEILVQKLFERDFSCDSILKRLKFCSIFDPFKVRIGNHMSYNMTRIEKRVYQKWKFSAFWMTNIFRIFFAMQLRHSVLWLKLHVYSHHTKCYYRQILFYYHWRHNHFFLIDEMMKLSILGYFWNYKKKKKHERICFFLYLDKQERRRLG